MLLGGLCISGSGGWLPCYELWKVLFKWANFSQAFPFFISLHIKYFSRVYSKFVCLWHVFPGREGLYGYSKFKTLAFYPLGTPLSDMFELVGFAGNRWSGYLFPLNLLYLFFLLMGSGWGLAMLGPGLFIFFLGRTAWFCVKKFQPNSFSRGREASGCGLVIPLLFVEHSHVAFFFPEITKKF